MLELAAVLVAAGQWRITSPRSRCHPCAAQLQAQQQQQQEAVVLPSTGHSMRLARALSHQRLPSADPAPHALGLQQQEEWEPVVLVVALGGLQRARSGCLQLPGPQQQELVVAAAQQAALSRCSGARQPPA